MAATRSSLVVFFCTPLLVPCVSADATRKKDPDKELREVHIVGIYEGVTKTGEMIHGPRAFVSVERPKKLVTLVLAAYSGVTWNVTVGDDTSIEQVILGGYERQAVVGVSKNTKIVEAYRGAADQGLIYSYRAGGPQFRMMTRQVSKRTGLPVASYHGTYRYDHAAGPFLIDKVSDDPRLSLDYPPVTASKDLPQLKFRALHIVQAGMHGHELDVSVGDFTLSGPEKNSLQPLPRGVKRLTYDSAGKKYYGITGHEIVEVDVERKQTTKIELSLDVPRVSWPRDVVFDPKRKRLLLLENQYILTYEPEAKKWSALCERPRQLQCIEYSEKEDCFYGLITDHSEDRDRPSICKLNAKGAVTDRFALGEPVLPGFVTEGPGAPTSQLVCVGDHLVLLLAPGGLRGGEHGAGEGWFIFLIDPKKTDVKLTYKQAK